MEHIEDNEVKTVEVTFSFGEILSLHKSGEIFIHPEYRKLFRWTNEQRSRLIESILLRLPIPPIFFIENYNGVLGLIDGLQRTYSVLQFLDYQAIQQDELVLQGCDILTEINGKKLRDFNTTDRFRFKRNSIRAIIVQSSSDEFVRYEMFKRYNTGGSLLSAQEIRNCSSRMSSGGARFNQILQELAADNNFKTAVERLSPQEVSRRTNEELVLRFFAVRNNRDKFSGNVGEWLDNFMENTLFRQTEVEMNPVSFKEFFAFVVRKFGNTAFSRFQNGQPIGRLEPTYYEAVAGALENGCEALEDISGNELKQTLGDAFESQEFKDASGPGADSRQKLEQRIEVIRKALLNR